MVEVNETLTRQVARLARLELTDEEARLFTEQLGHIIGYVEQLQQVPVTDAEGRPIEGLAHPIPLATPWREDAAAPFAPGAEGQPAVLESAPEVFDSGFKVPPIL